MASSSIQITLNSINELAAAAQTLLEFAGQQKIFLFYGHMGAGKTTFIKAICKSLGVTEAVSSPTFAIVNEYPAPASTIFHFDFYRLKDQHEALDLGYEEYFYSGNYCFIEWPEKIPNLLPEHYIEIKIEATGQQKRLISINSI